MHAFAQNFPPWDLVVGGGRTIQGMNLKRVQKYVTFTWSTRWMMKLWMCPRKWKHLWKFRYYVINKKKYWESRRTVEAWQLEELPLAFPGSFTSADGQALLSCWPSSPVRGRATWWVSGIDPFLSLSSPQVWLNRTKTDSGDQKLCHPPTIGELGTQNCFDSSRRGGLWFIYIFLPIFS